MTAERWTQLKIFEAARASRRRSRLRWSTRWPRVIRN